LKIFDYKAAGLACIASGEGDQPATLKHGTTGWIVPPCDEDALVEAIITLSGDQLLRKKMGQAARLEAERLHTWENTAAQLEKVMIACQME
jgi:glycosyltransferase involved in cell wall biosynthesis